MIKPDSLLAALLQLKGRHRSQSQSQSQFPVPSPGPSSSSAAPSTRPPPATAFRPESRAHTRPAAQSGVVLFSFGQRGTLFWLINPEKIISIVHVLLLFSFFPLIPHPFFCFCFLIPPPLFVLSSNESETVRSRRVHPSDRGQSGRRDGLRGTSPNGDEQNGPRHFSDKDETKKHTRHALADSNIQALYTHTAYLPAYTLPAYTLPTYLHPIYTPVSIGRAAVSRGWPVFLSLGIARP